MAGVALVVMIRRPMGVCRRPMGVCFEEMSKKSVKDDYLSFSQEFPYQHPLTGVSERVPVSGRVPHHH